MNRKQVEQTIYNHAKAIEEIINEYFPENDYFRLCISKGEISFNNAYWRWPDNAINFVE